jgi:hypothetical protein
MSTMSAMIDSPVLQVDQQSNRQPNRHRAHSLRPGPGRDAPAAVTAPPWTAEETWDERTWDDDKDGEHPPAATSTSPVLTPAATAPFPPPSAPAPAVDVHPALGPRPAAQPCDGLAVPPRRTVGPFPPIRAGGGRHRLPAAVRRRPGPIAAGLMVAATTLAAGTLRFSGPPPLRASADAGHQCGPLRPGEPCE